MKTFNAHKPVFLIFATALLLASCGVKGELKTPPPLWGDKAKLERKAKEEKSQQADNKKPDNNSAPTPHK